MAIPLQMKKFQKQLVAAKWRVGWQMPENTF